MPIYLLIKYEISIIKLVKYIKKILKNTYFIYNKFITIFKNTI